MIESITSFKHIQIDYAKSADLQLLQMQAAVIDKVQQLKEDASTDSYNCCGMNLDFADNIAQIVDQRNLDAVNYVSKLYQPCRTSTVRLEVKSY